LLRNFDLPVVLADQEGVMTAHIILFPPRRVNVVETLKAVQDEIQIVLCNETDSAAAADLLAVLETIETIIWRIRGPL
jgi:hypothetical protein